MRRSGILMCATQRFHPQFLGQFPLEAWSALNMANLTWAFAKLSLRHPKLFAAIATQQEPWAFITPKTPNAKHVSLGRVETHHSDIAKLNWWVSLDCKAGGTFWRASARVAIIYTWCIIYPNHGSQKKLLSFKDCPLKPDHPPIQILQSSGQERECQQKLWNFSSQNLVNVAWSFAKANLGILETLGVPTLW